MASEKQRKTFLSYSRFNKDFAIKLAKELKSEGFDIWLDQLDIPAGSRWDREVEKALRESEIFMIILTPTSVDSENVLDEIGYAIDNGKRFLPVLLEKCDIPFRLKRFQYVDFTNKNFDDGVESAKDLLKSLVAQPTIPREVVVEDAQTEAGHQAKEKEDRAAAQKAEENRIAKLKAEEELAAKAKVEIERVAREETDRLAAQKADSERLAKQKAEIERLAKLKSETERKEKEESDRLAAQKAEAERLAKQKAEDEQLAKAEADRKKKAKSQVAIPVEIKAEPLSQTMPAQKKPASKGLMYGGVAVVLLIIAGVAFSFLSNGGNKNSPAPTPTTQVAVIAPATEAPATPTLVLKIGSTLISEKDGMTLLAVPAGEFIMGSNDGQAYEQPVHKITLDAFWIDQTEITNAMFMKFVTETNHVTQAEKVSISSVYQGTEWKQVLGADWSHPLGSSSDISEIMNHPVVHLSWFDAKAYCAWAGRRLPTEAEWEKAARGEDGRLYPWGNNSPNNQLLNYDQYRQYREGITAVGSYPAGASPYGALDMAGNVAEWVADWYSANYYKSSPASNPLGPSSGSAKVLRGGAWVDDATFVMSAQRSSFDPNGTSNASGSFRCAMSTP